MADPTKKQEEDIVAMLDSFMAGGGGRMNIDAREASENSELNVQNEKFFGCSVVGGRKMACQTPTLMEGLDIDENE
ncbi:MAG: hypothetical protein J5757_05960 [Lachnospiraceae bacterium]|jgi:6-phosphogluconate dehydrogenase|nr:hypothetical protein [Lachnospiraceae bacterium]